MAEEQKNKLYVGNLPRDITEDDLRTSFGDYGEIEEVDVIMDQATGEPKGFAFITFASDDEAERAAQEMNEKDMKGRPMRVNTARPREER